MGVDRIWGILLGLYRDNGKLETTVVYYIRVIWDYMGSLEVRGTSNLPSICSYNLHISPITRVTLNILGL